MITDPSHLGYENKECLYDEDLSAQTSVTISDLDGNADEEYVIEVHGAAALTSDPYLTSTLSNSWVGSSLIWRTSTNPDDGDGVSGGRPLLGGGNNPDGSSHKIRMTARLTAKAGLNRWMLIHYMARYTGYIGGCINYVMHDTDTTTNIVSLTLNFGGSFTGNVKLYRVLSKG